MNLNHLNHFKELAETLSFTLAALNLRIAQPAVSRSIKALEDSLGVQLFNRNNKSVLLTVEGEHLYKMIIDSMGQIEFALNSVQAEVNELLGKIKIGALFELGEFKLIPIINQFMKIYPKIEIEIIYAGNRELNQLLMEGKIDFLFGISEIEQENLRTYKIFNQRAFLLTSGKNKKIEKDISKMSFALYRQDDPLLGSFLKKFYPKNSLRNIDKKVVVNSHASLVKILKEQPSLYGVLPELSESVFQAMSEGELQPVRKQALQTNIYMVHWEKDHESEKLKAFRKFVLEKIKE